MVICILSQLVLAFRGNLQVRNCLGLITIEVVAITQHVVFLTAAIVLIRKVKFQELNGIFEFAQVEI